MPELFEKRLPGISPHAYRSRQRLSSERPTHPIDKIRAKLSFASHEIIPGTALLSHVPRDVRAQVEKQVRKAGLPPELSFRPSAVGWFRGQKFVLSPAAVTAFKKKIGAVPRMSRGQLLALLTRK